MKQLQRRLSEETPAWFRRIIAGGIALSAAGGALLGAETELPGFRLPQQIHLFATWCMVAGIVAAAVAKTARDHE